MLPSDWDVKHYFQVSSRMINFLLAVEESSCNNGGMPRTRKPPTDDPGPFAKMLLAARHKARKNPAECARDCGLSRTFLTLIELGKRCPELERAPAIGLAYQANVAELCWAWVCQWAPAAVRYLSLTVDLEENQVITDYFHRAWLKQQAEAGGGGGGTPGKKENAQSAATNQKSGAAHPP